MDMKKTRRNLARKMLSSVAGLLIGFTPETSFAIEVPPVENPVPANAQPAALAAPAANTPAPAAPQPETASKSLSVSAQAQLEQLLAPIALYPDALLAQVLPASAYPLEIVQAQRWLEKNSAAAAKRDFSGADAQNWDPSVKALLRFPEVMKKLCDDLKWTTSLGDAIVNRPKDVANAIQALRADAMKASSLKTTKEQTVMKQKEHGREVVTIKAADPSVVYVPSYDPWVVYSEPPYDSAIPVAGDLLTFGAGVATGSLWRGNYWSWGTGAFYRPVWPGFPAWRPPYAGWRPGAPINAGNIQFGNGIANRPWAPDAARYRPSGRPGVGGGVNKASHHRRPGSRPTLVPSRHRCSRPTQR